MAHIDFKITSWERLNIPDDKMETAKQLIQEGKLQSASDAMELLELDDGPEAVEDTDEQMSPEDNGGQCTVELMDGNTIIMDNSI